MKKAIAIVVLLAALVWVFQAAEAGEIKGRIKIDGSFRSNDILVYIEGVDGGGGEVGKPHVIDQRDLTYNPRVSGVLVNTVVAFPNNDEVRHNVYSPSKGNSFNLGTYQAGKSKEVVFKKPGLVKILCNVHDDMEAYVWVFEKAVWDVTGRRGTFNIKNLSVGTHLLKIWHPDHGTITAKVDVPEVFEFNLTIGE